MPKNITVFTTNRCSYCVMVKRYLDSKKLKYDVVNLEENPEHLTRVLEMSGALTVPVVHILKEDDSEEVVIGYNLTRLAPALV